MHTPQVIMAWLILIVISHNGTHSFGYSKKEQHLWPHESCAGKLQSPVAIFTSKAVPLSCPALEMIGYNDPLPTQIKTNEHTVKFSMDKNATNKTLPYISGAMLQDQYKWEELHFHWGKKNNRGSEHMLNGKGYPMEMHIVHRNSKYSDLSQALKHMDGVVVLAVFFQLQPKDNERLRSFIDKLSDIKWAKSVNTFIVLASLIPSNTESFCTYIGSLTTPPCNEGVIWIIFIIPVPISLRQMNEFWEMHSVDGKSLGNNVRHLQDLNRHKIYCIALDLSKDIHNNCANLSWFWS